MTSLPVKPRDIVLNRGHLGLLPVAALLVSCQSAGAVLHVSTTARAVSLTVHVNEAGRVVPATALGINVQVWDKHLRDKASVSRLRALGAALIRYPGGSTSDVYHWQTNSITPGQQGYADPANRFDAFIRSVVMPARARAMITVNYGSDASGQAGASPTEAAAWVRHANLVHHDAVRYWEIGNEVYGNGYYGSGWETDLHADRSPRMYATTALAYIRAMKAVDPTIKVGLVLVAPGLWPDNEGPEDWNRTVLSIAGKAADFVSIHWYPQNPGSESDVRLLRSPDGIPGMVSRLRGLLTRLCGAQGKRMEIMVTETNSVSSNPGKQTVSGINGLFAFHSYLAWLYAGVDNVTWWALHNSPTTAGKTYGDYGLLSSGDGPEPPANTPFPTFDALLLARSVARPGARFLTVTGATGLVTCYALRAPSGHLYVALLNSAPTTPQPVGVHLAGWMGRPVATAESYSVQKPTTRRGTVEVSGPTLKTTLAARSVTVLSVR